MRKTTARAAALILGLGLASCSVTRNMPEDETLYRGIKRLSYGAAPRRGQESGEEGVITALAGAYNTVEGLLSGDASALARRGGTDKERRDSLRKAGKMDAEAAATARKEVEAVLAYAPNGALMGSSYVTHPFPLRLMIYDKYVHAKHRFGKWMLNHFSAAPVYVSTVGPKVRQTVARNTLRNHGYFRGSVTHELVPGKNPRKARISYAVSPGPLFHLDSVAYLRFPPGADSIVRATLPGSRLRRGAPFSAAELDAERQRLSAALRENGYYYHRPDYVAFRADTLQSPLKVQLRALPSPAAPPQAMRPYRLGRTRVNVYKYNDYRLTDSLQTGGYTYAYSGGGRKPPLRPGAVLRHLRHGRGETYRQSRQQLAREKLQAMGVFSSLSVGYAPSDTSALCDTLDITVNAVLDKPYDAEFLGSVTAKSNDQVGPGASFSMSKANAFRGAETLTLQAWGSYEWQTGADLHGDRSLINSYEYGASGSLSFPRLMPFGRAGRLNRRVTASTDVSVSARWMNRANYFGRVSLGAGLTYTLRRGRNVRHEITPLSLTYDQLLHSTASFDSITRANAALYVSMRDQLVPGMEYTFTWSSTRHHQRTLKVSAKEAGNLTSAVFRAAGKPFGREGKKLAGVPFAQYVKATAQYTHLFPLTARSRLATRVMLGAVYSYGNAMAAPYSDLFSIGGANSVRAFAVRSIGPGSYRPAGSDYSYIDQTGDLKLEANAEYRFPIVAQLQGAVFLDAGNVWLLRSNPGQPGGRFNLARLGRDIALGTGAGLRYDLDFLVLRLDVGVGIHAPYDTGRRGYYNMPGFGRSLGYHFAIGYPF